MKLTSYIEWKNIGKKAGWNRVASDMYGNPHYMIPYGHIFEMIKMLPHPGPGQEDKRVRISKLIRTIKGMPGNSISPNSLARLLGSLKLNHLIQFIMPSYQGTSEPAGEAPKLQTLLDDAVEMETKETVNINRAKWEGIGLIAGWSINDMEMADKLLEIWG